MSTRRGRGGRWHVLGHGGRLSVVAAPVRRHAAALEEDLDGRRRVADLDLLAEELERHAVGVSLDDDVVVDVEAAQLPLREDVARGRQGLEGRTVELLVEGAAADAELLQRPVVELVEEDADRLVQRAEAEERLVAESGEYPVLGQKYSSLDRSLRQSSKLDRVPQKHRRFASPIRSIRSGASASRRTACSGSRADGPGRTPPRGAAT